jgi:hypothetical protein
MRTGSWTAQYVINANAGADAIYTNLPAGETFLFGSSRHVVLADITGMTYVRLKVNKLGTAASSGTKLVLRYSPTFSATAASYADIGTSEVSVLIDTVNTYQATSWVQIDPSAFVPDDVYLAVIAVHGGGSTNLDPAFGNISVSFC